MRRTILTVLLLCLLTSCRSSRLPGFAEPTGESIDPSKLEGKDHIAYRPLSPDDFKGKAPPPEMKQYAERMGAVTCAHVFTHPDPRYYVQQTEQGYFGAYERLSFVARMDRECSWWNPNSGHVPEAYILQHEQIHFALAESTARVLNERAKKVLSDLRPEGPTQSSVEKVLRGTVEEMMEEEMSRLLKRNLDFDRDTSNTYAPEKQQQWYDQVMRELN